MRAARLVTGTDGAAVLPDGVTRYADSEAGRTILKAVADSIEFANSLDPECWVTLFDRRRRDMRLYVGSTLMMVLEATRKRVEVTLLPMEDERHDSLRSAQVLHEYNYPEGAKRYLLTWSEFIEHWASIRAVHQETMRLVVMKAPRAAAHRTDAIEFLNRALGTELPQPGYVDQDDSFGPTSSGGSQRPLGAQVQGGTSTFPRTLRRRRRRRSGFRQPGSCRSQLQTAGLSADRREGPENAHPASGPRLHVVHRVTGR